MKLVIASDIHGAADWCQKLLDAVDQINPDRLVLLGDILYHGPRNDLPADYAPKRVIAQLNDRAEKIICVRGNCEAEVDQMVLDFPCMADHNILVDPDAAPAPGTAPAPDAAPAPGAAPAPMTLFFTHGHVYGPGLHNSVDRWPTLPPNSALVYGHTHKKVLEELPGHPGVIVFNPGSVGIPKDGTHSFGLYDNGAFTHVVLD